MTSYGIAWVLIAFMSWILIKWNAKLLEKSNLVILGDLFYVPENDQNVKIRKYTRKDKH